MSPDSFDSLCAQADAHIARGDTRAAEAVLHRASRASPEKWLRVVEMLIAEKAFAQADARALLTLNNPRASAFARGMAAFYCGVCRMNMGRADASAMFQRASQLVPRVPEVWSNLGVCRMYERKTDEALRCYARALELNPWNTHAQFNRAMCLLLAGHWLEGFDAYEARWRHKDNRTRKVCLNRPEWTGAATDHLLVCAEQGMGDTVMMLRYARDIAGRAQRQTWIVHTPLVSLVQRTLPHISVIPVGQPIPPDVTAYTHTMSLPRVLCVETVSGEPYLDIARAPERGLVGIAWRGSAANANDGFRSVSLSAFAPVLRVAGLRFVSLQPDGAEEARASGLDTPPLSSWADTLDVLRRCECVVSVDTALAHVAGACGVPCHVALHARPYFAYPFTHETTTPWYNSVTLHRQAACHQWDCVMQSIAQTLTR